MSGLQGTNYPVSYREQKDILNEYMVSLWNEKKNHFVKPKNFVGPSSYTLQMYNIMPTEDTDSPNINNNYTVTDKADGDRKLLYISSKVFALFFKKINEGFIFFSFSPGIFSL